MSNEKHEDVLVRMSKTGAEGSVPVPAATVILLRDHSNGLETLMLKKTSKIAFGGMWVFPGGRVDPADAHGLADDDDLGAARVAAAREAAEEASLHVDSGALVPFSHWTPPPVQPRRFITWFFVASAPASQVVIDDGEIRDHEWMTPETALAKRDAGEIEIAPPTYVSLFELARWRSVTEALEAAAARPPERFATQIAVQAEGPVALWHGDAGWEAGDVAAAGPRHRLTMVKGGVWSYERHDG